MCQKSCQQVFRPKLVQGDNAADAEPTRRSGFSLLELVLVLAIMATLAAIAVPRYQASLARYRADLAARRIVADLAFARSAAKASSSSRRVKFFVNSDLYRLFELQPLDGVGDNYDVALFEKPYEADIISANFGADDQIIFDGWGIPDTGGAVVLTVGPEQRTVTVDAESGKAKVE